MHEDLFKNLNAGQKEALQVCKYLIKEIKSYNHAEKVIRLQMYNVVKSLLDSNSLHPGFNCDISFNEFEQLEKEIRRF